jgi:hypothetical protein
MDLINILAKFDAVENNTAARTVAQEKQKNTMSSLLESLDRISKKSLNESAYPSVSDFASHVVNKAKEIQQDGYYFSDSTQYEFMDDYNDLIDAWQDGELSSEDSAMMDKIMNALPHVDMSEEEIKATVDELAAGGIVRPTTSESKKSKPDFLDMDKDGNKKEPMKKAVADMKNEAPIKEGVAISPKYIKHLQLALRNWDSPLSRSETRQLQNILDKQSIANIKTIMNSDIPHLSQMAKLYLRNKTPGGMKNYSEAEVQSSDVELEEAIMVSAEGDEAESLLQILKLSGMPTPPAPAALPAPMAEPAADLDTIDIEMQDEYSNSPDEFEQDVSAVIANGTDLHREKGQYPAAARGDNPMNAFEGKFKAIMADLLKE